MAPEMLALATVIMILFGFVDTGHAFPGKLPKPSGTSLDMSPDNPHVIIEIDPLPSSIISKRALRKLKLWGALSMPLREINEHTEAAVAGELHALRYSSANQLDLNQHKWSPEQCLALLRIIRVHREEKSSADWLKSWGSSFSAAVSPTPTLFSQLEFDVIKFVAKVASIPKVGDGDDGDDDAYLEAQHFLQFRQNALQPNLGWTQYMPWAAYPSSRLQVHGNMLSDSLFESLVKMILFRISVADRNSRREPFMPYICFQHSAKLRMLVHMGTGYVRNRSMFFCPNPATEPVYNISKPAESKVNHTGMFNLIDYYALDGSEPSCVIGSAAKGIRAAIRRTLNKPWPPKKEEWRFQFHEKLRQQQIPRLAGWLDVCEKKHGHGQQ